MTVKDKEGRLKSLFHVISLLDNPSDIRDFLEDLCTPTELKAFAERWHIVEMLETQAYSYRDISKVTGASTTTIGRVARFLRQQEKTGYSRALNVVQNYEKMVGNSKKKRA